MSSISTSYIPKEAWSILESVGINFQNVYHDQMEQIFATYDGRICDHCGGEMGHDPHDDRGDCENCYTTYFYPEVEPEAYVKKDKIDAWREVVENLLELAHKAPLIRIVDVSQQIIEWIRTDPRRIANLGPDRFELLVAELLNRMGMGVKRTGHVNRKDGGIDIIAWPEFGCEISYLMAVQAKHHKSFRSTGVNTVRDFIGALSSQPFDVGLLVTNTSFTPDALWVVKQWHRILRLKDFRGLRRWIVGDFLPSSDMRDFPKEIEISPGLRIEIPQFKMSKR